MVSEFTLKEDYSLRVQQAVQCTSIMLAADHMGIQFNSTSNGRGSRIDNASFVHATYGITIYNSDPYIANVTLWNLMMLGLTCLIQRLQRYET